MDRGRRALGHLYGARWRVGLSEREAQEKSLAVTVTRVGYDDNDRAIAEGKRRALSKC